MICCLRFVDLPWDCDGPPQWHHVIKQQRIRNKFRYGAEWDFRKRQFVAVARVDEVTERGTGVRTLDQIVGDTRNRIWLCRGHHELVTGATLRVAIPDCVWRFAEEYGFVGQLQNDLDKLAA